jgi:hypothetical protein
VLVAAVVVSTLVAGPLLRWAVPGTGRARHHRRGSFEQRREEEGPEGAVP